MKNNYNYRVNDEFYFACVIRKQTKNMIEKKQKKEKQKQKKIT